MDVEEITWDYLGVTDTLCRSADFLLMRGEAATALPVACPHMGQHGQFGQSQGRPQAVQWLLCLHERKIS